MKYTLDSNILIHLIRRYPRDIFTSIWQVVEESANQGQVCICEVALVEIKRGTDELYNWAKNLAGFCCKSITGEMELACQISNKYPGWVRENKNYADPFVIAHAQWESRILVTDERRKGPGTIDKNLTIPNIADNFGVETIGFFEYLRGNGWKF